MKLKVTLKKEIKKENVSLEKWTNKYLWHCFNFSFGFLLNQSSREIYPILDYN